MCLCASRPTDGRRTSSGRDVITLQHLLLSLCERGWLSCMVVAVTLTTAQRLTRMASGASCVSMFGSWRLHEEAG